MKRPRKVPAKAQSNHRREQDAWAERARGASIKLGILMRQVKIKPEHIKPSTRRTAS